MPHMKSYTRFRYDLSVPLLSLLAHAVVGSPTSAVMASGAQGCAAMHGPTDTQ